MEKAMSKKMISCPDCKGIDCKLCDGFGEVPESVLLVGKRKPTASEIVYGKTLEAEELDSSDE